MTTLNGRIAEKTPENNKPDYLAPVNPGLDFLTEKEWSECAILYGLSRREVDVAKWLMLGDSRKKIACQLNISSQTVRVHLEHLFQKCQVQTSRNLCLRIAQFRTKCHDGTLSD